MITDNISALFNPTSVAIVGLSDRKGSVGAGSLTNLRNFGYAGEIWGVHPKRSEISGVPCFPSLGDLPAVPEAVIICVGGESVVTVAEEAGKLGVKAAVSYASGFAEVDGGDALQARLTATCRVNELAFAGPNCLGVFSPANSSALYYSSLPENMSAGGVALLSHSGSICIAMVSCGRFAFSHVISAGNEAVLDAGAYLHHFAADPKVEVIALIVETVRDVASFRSGALAAARAGKPVICLKLGRTDVGAKAAAAHTGALVGSYDEFQAFAESVGVVVVRDLDELTETVELLASGAVPAEGGLAILSLSGGENSLVSDLATDAGVVFPELADETIATLTTVLPDFANPRNPLDATGSAVHDGDMYRAALRALIADPGIGLVGVGLDAPTGLDRPHAHNYARIAADVAAVAGETHKPIFFMSSVGAEIDPLVRGALGPVPGLQGIREGMAAVSAALAYPALRERALSRSAAMDAEPPTTVVALPEATGRAMIAAYELPIPGGELTSDVQTAAEAAERIGFPVALKISSPDILHKTEIGGVALNIASVAELTDAYVRMEGAVTAAEPDARLDGILVEEMVPQGVELLVSLRRTPFGVLVTVGLGGILVELIRSTASALAPITDRDVDRLLAESRASEFLAGVRGAEPSDETGVRTFLMGLNRLAATLDERIGEVEFNPVTVLGKGLRVIDVVVTPSQM
ncbi:acetate--CoA ligase family protein [Mycobacterium sp. 236(2023)]|uniref:acetate--CoA ligase family protein n=1 Tax=Mycobacterium sp. 236(2023) TaxID=3038163 RepID=UPI002414FEAE|nr:acetate--CoA ligase family protein [Mycobacterium sp. 236(2023)]MDG4663806.1 acetate--CoA ligase family protein [Mycobacterium sp. 236(2023)]